MTCASVTTHAKLRSRIGGDVTARACCGDRRLARQHRRRRVVAIGGGRRCYYLRGPKMCKLGQGALNDYVSFATPKTCEMQQLGHDHII